MRLMTISELADMLSVKAKTIYSWAELGLIPHVKLNGALRFDRDDIEKWLASCKREVRSGYNACAQTSRCPKREVRQ